MQQKLVKINNSETFGYSLLNSTIDNLIRSFEGQQAVTSYIPTFEKKKNALMN